MRIRTWEERPSHQRHKPRLGRFYFAVIDGVARTVPFRVHCLWGAMAMTKDSDTPDRLETIQKQIDSCRAQAEKATDPKSKEAWTRMANEWENLRKAHVATRTIKLD